MVGLAAQDADPARGVAAVRRSRRCARFCRCASLHSQCFPGRCSRCSRSPAPAPRPSLLNGASACRTARLNVIREGNRRRSGRWARPRISTTPAPTARSAASEPFAMPDQRQHRGRHPADSRLFASAEVPVLRRATEELSWLLERGYSQVATLKLVGDHFGLRERQRLAVLRSSCGASAAAERGRRRLADVWADGAQATQFSTDEHSSHHAGLFVQFRAR